MAQVDVILDVDAWRRRVQEEEARVRAATPEPPVIPESLFEDSLAVSPADPATTGVPTFEEWQAQKRSRDSRFGTATDEQIAEARQVRADKIRAWARDPEWHSNPFPKPVGLEAIIARESGMDPKKTATARWFAEKTKLPFEFVEKNIDWVVKEWKAHSFDTEKMHRESPAITHLLQRAPGNFAVIADDMAHAANYEKNALAPWKASLHRGPAQVEAALRSMFGYAGGGRVEKATSTAQAAVAKGHRPEIAEGLALLSLVGIDIVDDKLVESFSDLNDERISHLKEAHLNRWFGEPSGLEIDERRIAVEVGTAAPQLVQSYGLAAVGAGIGFLVAGPVGAAIGMKAAPMANAFMMEYGPAYDALREYESDGRMFDESTARMGAIGIALVNAAIEIASMSTVLRAGKSVIRGGGKEAARGVVTNLGIAAMRSWLKKSGRKELLKSAAKLWLTSAAAEGTEEFFQDLTQVGARVILKSVEGGEWRPENAAENIGNAFDAFYSTAIGMLALGPLTAGGTAAFGYKRARRADRVAAIYGALSGTKLKMAEEGMGDELVHLAQDYAERTGAPDSFYLSVEDFESVVSKMKDEDGNPLAPEAVASAAFSDPSAYATAKRDGTDIAIPVGDMISKLAGTKFARAILPYVSMHSGGASVISELGVEAARKALSDQGVHLKGLLETAVSEYTPEQQQIYEAERIEIEKQLSKNPNLVGKRSDIEYMADAYARIRVAASTQLARRSGMTPMQLYLSQIVRVDGFALRDDSGKRTAGVVEIGKRIARSMTLEEAEAFISSGAVEARQDPEHDAVELGDGETPESRFAASYGGDGVRFIMEFDGKDIPRETATVAGRGASTVPAASLTRDSLRAVHVVHNGRVEASMTPSEFFERDVRPRWLDAQTVDGGFAASRFGITGMGISRDGDSFIAADEVGTPLGSFETLEEAKQAIEEEWDRVHGIPVQHYQESLDDKNGAKHGEARWGIPYWMLVTADKDPTGELTLAGRTKSPDRAAQRIKDLFAKYPMPWKNARTWRRFMAEIMGTRSKIPPEPYALLAGLAAGDIGAPIRELTEPMRLAADRGLAQAAEMGKRYEDGTAKLQHSARLLIWNLLSGQTDPYSHESGFIFIDHFMPEYIDAAVRGEFDEDMKKRWLKEVETRLPTVARGGTALPATSAKNNLNTAAKLLSILGNELPGGKTVIEEAHSILGDRSISAKLARRKLYALLGGTGLSVKTISFALLSSGWDVMVPDRWIVRFLWNDGRFVDDDGKPLEIYGGIEEPGESVSFTSTGSEVEFRYDWNIGSERSITVHRGSATNLFGDVTGETKLTVGKDYAVEGMKYDGGKIRLLNGPLDAGVKISIYRKGRRYGLAHIFEEWRGIAILEAIESAVETMVDEVYISAGRPGEGSLARYHWETWSSESGIEAGHETLGRIFGGKVAAVDSNYASLTYGTRHDYDYSAGSNPFFLVPSLVDGSSFLMDADGHREYFKEVQALAQKIKGWIGGNRTESVRKRNAPWYDDPAVTQEHKERIHAIALKHSIGTGRDIEKMYRIITEAPGGIASVPVRLDQPPSTETPTQVSQRVAAALARDPGMFSDPARTPLNTERFAILSGWRASADLATNKRQVRAMLTELRDAGYVVYAQKGEYGGIEPSFIVFGMGEDEAIDYGERYGQETVLTHHGMRNIASLGLEPIFAIEFGGPYTEYYSEIKIGGKRIQYKMELGPKVETPLTIALEEEEGRRERGEDVDAPMIPIGLVTLRHYSNNGNLVCLSPDLEFSKEGHAGSERQEIAAYPDWFAKRTYFEMLGQQPYKEPRITRLPYRYEVDVPGERIYDLSKDPDGYIQKAMKVIERNRETGDGPISGAGVLAVKLVADARNADGERKYWGYRATDWHSGVVGMFVRLSPDRKAVDPGNKFSVVLHQEAAEEPEVGPRLMYRGEVVDPKGRAKKGGLGKYAAKVLYDLAKQSLEPQGIVVEAHATARRVQEARQGEKLSPDLSLSLAQLSVITTSDVGYGSWYSEKMIEEIAWAVRERFDRDLGNQSSRTARSQFAETETERDTIRAMYYVLGGKAAGWQVVTVPVSFEWPVARESATRERMFLMRENSDDEYRDALTSAWPDPLRRNAARFGGTVVSGRPVFWDEAEVVEMPDAPGRMEREIIAAIIDMAEKYSQQERSAPFRRWFRKSKVVGRDGLPLITAHTAQADFDVFSRSLDVGYHFGSIQAALRRSGDVPNPVLMRCYLSIQNPFRVQDPGHWGPGVLREMVYLAMNDRVKAGKLSRQRAREMRAMIDSASDAADLQAEHWEMAGKRNDGWEFKTVAMVFRGLMMEMGYDGLVYFNRFEGGGDSWVAFEPWQIKSATANRGTFSRASESILEQEDSTLPTPASLLRNNADKAPRGCLAFVPGNNQEYFLSLFATADKSTLFHELGHYLLEQFAYAATSPGASEELQADYAKALKWMGYASGHDRKLDLLAIRELLEEKRSRAAEGKKLPKKSQAILDAAIEKQERWAKAWESYLQDGKAPTPELATAFARLRVWLTDLYYRLKSKLPPLDDEIRGVFDRLLAAQEGVAEAQDEIGRGAVPDALMEVATEADKKRLRSLAASAKIKAEERLFALVMEDVSRDVEAWFQQERAQVEEEISSMMGEEPRHLLRAALDGIRVPSSIKGLSEDAVWDALRPGGKLPRISEESMVAAYGDDWRSKFPRMRRWVKADGERFNLMALGDLATMFGFGSADEMLAQLSETGPWGATLKKQVQEEMEARFPSLMQNRPQRAAEAMNATANEDEVERVIEQIRIAARALKKSKVRYQPVDAAALRSKARDIIGSKLVKDLKPWLFLKQAWKYAHAAQTKTDMAEIYDLKTKELWAFTMYRESERALKNADAIYKKMRRYGSGKYLAKIGKMYPQGDFPRQIMSILARFEFKKVSAKSLEGKKSLEVMRAELEAAGRSPILSDDVVNESFSKNYRLLTVGQLEGLSESVESIAAQAELMGNVFVGMKKIDWHLMKQRLLERIEKSLPVHGRFPIARGLSESPASKLGGVGKIIDASTVKLEVLALEFDGGDANGPWSQLYTHLLADAQKNEYKWMRDYGQRVMDAIDKMPDALKKRLFSNDVIHIDSIDQDFTLRDIVAVCLNLGNESNAAKLLMGWQTTTGNLIPWTVETIEEIRGHMNEDLFDFCQGIWDGLQSMWPEIEALEFRQTGIKPRQVEAMGFTYTRPDGTTKQYRGGYYPVVYDNHFSHIGGLSEEVRIQDLFSAFAAKAMTPHGHRIARIEAFSAPVKIDINALPMHVMQVIHDLAFSEAIIQIWRMTCEPEIKNAIIWRKGDEYYSAIKERIKRVAQVYAPTTAFGDGFWTKFLSFGQSATTAGILGLKFSVWFQNVFNITIAFSAVGNSMWGGLHEFYTRRSEWLETMAKYSSEMGDRFKHWDAAIEAATQKFQLRTDWRAQITRATFYLSALTDAFVAFPMWVAAFRKSIDEGMSPEDAGRVADSLVRTELGAASSKDMSAIQDSKVMKPFMMFTAWATVAYQQQRKRILTARERILNKLVLQGIFWLIVHEIGILFFPGVVSEYFVGRGPDDDESWLSWMWMKALGYLISPLPVVRDMVRDITDDGQRAGNRYVPGLHYFELLGKAVKEVAVEPWKDDKEMKDAIPTVVELLAMSAKLPVSQAKVTLGYWNDVLRGVERVHPWRSIKHSLIRREEARKRKSKARAAERARRSRLKREQAAREAAGIGGY